MKLLKTSVLKFIDVRRQYGRHPSGFTLIELLITIALIGGLAGMGLLIGLDFYKSYALISEKDTLISILRQTRTRALVNFNQSSHGLYIGPDAYTIFQGPSFANRSSTWDQLIQRAPGITLTGPQEIVFNQLTAASSVSSTIYLSDDRLISQGTYSLPTRSGSYTGNGIDNRAITDASFQPDLVIIKGDTAQNAVLRSSSMTGDNSKALVGAIALENNLIQSLDADGFTVGTDVRVNLSGVVYHWTAFKASDGKLSVGSYGGDGSANHFITGIGFQPEYIIVASAGTNEAVHRSTTMSKTYFFNAEDDDTGNRIISFNISGFSVGNSSRVNTGGVMYHYAAWNAISGEMNNGSYGGDSNDNRDINYLGLMPEYVIIRGEGLRETVHKSSSTGPLSDITMDFRASANNPNEIQKLEKDKFQVGTDVQTNTAGAAYNWMAFASQITLPRGFIEINYEGRINW